MDVLETKKKHERLGFTKLETAEIANEVNSLLASEAVFYHKLRAFHWNVQGRDFYDLHEKFEALYNEVKVNIDDFAERVRVFGKTPIYKLKEIISTSLIKEEDCDDMSGEVMVRSIVADIEILLEHLLGVTEVATQNGDMGTAQLANNSIQSFEKTHWMLTSWLNVHPSEK